MAEGRTSHNLSTDHVAEEDSFKLPDMIDEEREVGLTQEEREDIKREDDYDDDVNANLSKKGAVDDKMIEGGGSAGSPCLLKGDKVFAFSTEVSHWTYFISKRRCVECKFVIGDVVLWKEWKDHNLALHIRWQNGKFEKLRGASENIAFTDRVFVMDRECLGPGSKVYLAGYPNCEGTVLNKRYIATASDCENPEAIFEDIDSSKLVRHSYGHAYVGNKILYQGWIGLTSDYRVRVHLKPESDSDTVEGGSFSIVVESQQAKNFVHGQKLSLGLNLLRMADFPEEFGSNWFVNFFRYFNTTAWITKMEIEELKVYWIGKASNPLGEQNPFDIPDAPDTVIRRDDLEDVEYLVGDIHLYMKQNTLWKYQPEADEKFTESNLMGKAKWSKKWQKKLDWDRWEYPGAEEVKDKERFLSGERILKIMYTRAVFDVEWNSGNVTTLDASDLVPLHAGSIWSDMLRIKGGTVVENLLKRKRDDSYGVIKQVVDDQTATVKWIKVKGDTRKVTIKDIAMPLYDLQVKMEYDYLSKIDQCPLVSSKCGAFKIGTVKAIDHKSCQVHIQLPDGGDIHQWPHELIHFKCDVLFCPIDGHWVSWYEHVLAPPGVRQVAPEVENPNNESTTENNNKLETSVTLDIPTEPVTKKKMECVDFVPDDNCFANEEIVPRLRETHYRRAVDTEVEEMERLLPDGMWLEYYTTRGDIMSAAILGPERTIFEDFLFIFDLLLLEDFPNSEPHINFRSMGITIFPSHFCKSGAVFLPEETRLTEEDFTFSYVLNLLLEVKDFMSTPLEVIQKKDNEKLIGGKQGDPMELYKFVLLSLLDYAIALIRKPPINWNVLVQEHYSKALPRIIGKYKKGKLHMKRVIAIKDDDKGDTPASEKVEMVPIPWSETFAESIMTRVDELQKLHSEIAS